MLQIPYRNYVVAPVAISFATVLAALLFSFWLPPQIPLFYGLPEEEQLAPTLGIIIPGVVALTACGVNILISMLLEDEFLKKTLVAASFAASFFAAITTLKIIWLIY